MTSFGRLLGALCDAGVDFVIIGGVALVSRGGSRMTNDLDLVDARNSENLARLVVAVAPLHPAAPR